METSMSKKELAARVIDNRMVQGLWRASGRDRKGLRILAYHRVLDDQVNSFAFDKDVISANSEDFYQQMKFVSRHFEVISFADLHQCERENRNWPDRALIVTFDDGYKDNYTHAYPILKAFHIPATIFLVTGHIGQNKLFWWDAIAYCVKQTKLAAKDFPAIAEQPLQLTDQREKELAIQRILGWIKQVPDEVSRQFVARLPEELEVEMPEGVSQGMHLSWDEVKEMAENKIEFGSHTVTHPILANVGEEQLESELFESKKTIEQNLNKEILALSYPVGRKTKFNRLTQQAAAKQGFRYAVSYEEGLVFQQGYDRYAMPRIHVETENSKSLFRASLMFPNFMLRAEKAKHSIFDNKEALSVSAEIAQQADG
jgi:peptidoglycan/xylan/chitin deacetylase (PgdA/CDA1 family)